MKRFAMFTVLASLGVSPVLAAAPAFEKTWADATKIAEAKEKLIYLHFATTWCGWCRKIEKETYASEAGSAALAEFVSASLDCTVPRGAKPSPAAKINIDLKNEFGGGGYPFLVVTTPEKAVLNTVGGYVGPERFVKELEKAKAVHKELLAFEAWAAKAEKNGYEYNAKAMAMYGKVRLSAKAAAAAGKVRKLDPADKKGDAAAASWVLLNVAARMPQTPPPAAKARETKVQSLLADIRKFDPKNAKAFLEKALFMGFGEAFVRARRAGDAAARYKLLAEAEGKLKELAKAAPKFGRLQYMWAVLGNTYAQAGKLDDARTALNTALEVDPDSRLAEQIKSLLKQIKTPK